MPLTTPAATNYPSPLVMVPCDNQMEPVEGRQMVPVEILWGSMGGTTKTVNLNFQNNAAMEISQVSSLRIDNSACTVPVTFVFPDMSAVFVVPANAKLALIPVFSNALQFTVSAPTAVGTDITRFSAMNFPVLPVYVP